MINGNFSIKKLSLLEVSDSSGSGVSEVELGEVNGFIESVSFDADSALNVQLFCGDRLIVDRKNEMSFVSLLRATPENGDGEMFNFGPQKIPVLGVLRVRVDGNTGVGFNFSVVIS